jgi:fructokinase
MPDRSGFDVLVIGEALVDLIDTGASVTERTGGSPANVALGLGRLGARVALLTHLGRDARGDAVAAHLEQSGVVILPQSFSADRTSTAVAKLRTDGSAEYEFDIDWRIARGAVPHVRIVHTGSIAAFLEPGASSVRELLAADGADEVTFDANIRPALLGTADAARRTFEETAALSSVVKLSDEDAAWLYPDSTVEEVLHRVLALGARLAVATLGSQGSLLLTDSASARVPSAPTEVVDTIGAGDTYMASLIDSLLITSSAELTTPLLAQFGARAARAAAITVSRAGADLPWRDQLGADE